MIATHWLLFLTTGTGLLFFVFSLTWAVQLKTKNAAIVDAVWSASFPLLAVTYFLLSEGISEKKVALLLMVIVWGTRLAGYLFIRAISHAEDIRYVALREQWGSRQQIFMLRFFYFQAILALILSLPFALVMANPATGLTSIERVGLVIWLVALIGESTADWQLKNFKSNPANKGKICQAGLWNYSRHPNYFFEWLIWIAYFVFAIGSPWGWISILCPTAILYFLLRVTGIPYTEQQMIKSRGQAFVEYQQSTSAFVPWLKKKSKS